MDIDSGDDCITLWIYLMPLNCTLKHGQSGKLYIFFHNKKWKQTKKIQCYWTEQNRFQSQKVHGRPFIKVYDAQLRSPEHSPSSYWWPPASLWLLAWRAFFQPSWGNIRKWLRMAISWSCPQPLTNVYWRIKVPNSSFFGRNNSGKYLRPSPKVPSGADSLIPEEITCSLIGTIPY